MARPRLWEYVLTDRSADRIDPGGVLHVYIDSAIGVKLCGRTGLRGGNSESVFPMPANS